MYSDKLLLTQNYQAIEQATKLGIPAPEAEQTHTKFLFRAVDVKRAVVDADKILLDFYDGESYSIGFDQEVWDKLEFNFEEEEI